MWFVIQCRKPLYIARNRPGEVLGIWLGILWIALHGLH